MAHFVNLKSMTKLHNKINWKFLGLYSLTILNLLLMHYSFEWNAGLESYDKCRYISNLWACFVDATLFYLIFYLVTFKKVKLSLILTFALTFVLAVANSIYAAYWNNYLPINGFTSLGNLGDSDTILGIFSGLKWNDLFFLLPVALFIPAVRKWDRKCISKNSFKSLVLIPAAILTCMVLWFPVHRSLGKHFYSFHDDVIDLVPYKSGLYQLKPRIYTFKMGFARRFFYNLDEIISKPINLTEEQVNKIEEYCSDNSERVSRTWGTPVKDKNLILIIVESYNSVSSDLVVDGKEITPFLNRLKKEDGVYFNPNLKSNIALGQSSDGQFIYMTGLLPDRTKITINEAKDRSFKALPQLLKKKGRIRESHMIIPTNAGVWLQDRMCKVYGIDTLYSNHSPKDLNDGEVFSLAAGIDTTTAEPFFSTILTMTMHAPYNLKPDLGFDLEDSALPEKYRHYLIDCHYFDSQIEKYIEALKASGVYDRSVIVIVADHGLFDQMVDMKDNLPPQIPLYIINGGFDPQQAWKGSCNQLDVFTTLNDILLKDQWAGLGHTLLNNTYTESFTEDAETVSSLIIKGDYFRRFN